MAPHKGIILEHTGLIIDNNKFDSNHPYTCPYLGSQARLDALINQMKGLMIRGLMLVITWAVAKGDYYHRDKGVCC